MGHAGCGPFIMIQLWYQVPLAEAQRWQCGPWRRNGVRIIHNPDTYVYSPGVPLLSSVFATSYLPLWEPTPPWHRREPVLERDCRF